MTAAISDFTEFASDSLWVHPAASTAFPVVNDTGPEFTALVGDISRNGLRHPIFRTLRGAVLDGRARIIACHIAGVEPRFRVHNGDPWRFVLTANQRRLEPMSLNQRSLVAATVALHPECRLTGRQLMELCRVSFGSLNRAKHILKRGVPLLVDLIENGTVQLSTGERICKLSDEEQLEFAELARAGSVRRRAEPKNRAHYEPPPAPITQRQARYRYVQETAMRLIADSFDSLDIVIRSAEGLDPAVTPDQAAHWRNDLIRRAKSYRQLMTLLKERSKHDQRNHDEAGAHA